MRGIGGVLNTEGVIIDDEVEKRKWKLLFTFALITKVSLK